MSIARATRAAELRRFLELLRIAFREATSNDAARCELADSFFEQLAEERQACQPVASRLPVSPHFETAVTHVLDRAAKESKDRKEQREKASSLAICKELVLSLAALEPLLAWNRRAGSAIQGEPFHSNHANAFLIGPGGLERVGAAAVGITLVAPDIRYPDHEHPPEELYLVLSQGEWRQADSPWFEPGIGGVVHNPPGIVHAMRSAKEPLLAVWCLLQAASK